MKKYLLETCLLDPEFTVIYCMHGLFGVPDVDSAVVGVDVEGLNSGGGGTFGGAGSTIKLLLDDGFLRVFIEDAFFFFTDKVRQNRPRSE